MDILELIDLGARNVAEHDESLQLRASAELFLDLYAPYSGCRVMAASPHAERVLGAAMIIDPNLQGGGVESTIILDVNIASGTLMARAVKRLRDAGNTNPIVGIVLNSLMGQLFEWQVPGMSQLIVSHSLVRGQSVTWKPGYCGEDGVLLTG